MVSSVAMVTWDWTGYRLFHSVLLISDDVVLQVILRGGNQHKQPVIVQV